MARYGLVALGARRHFGASGSTLDGVRVRLGAFRRALLSHVGLPSEAALRGSIDAETVLWVLRAHDRSIENEAALIAAVGADARLGRYTRFVRTEALSLHEQLRLSLVASCVAGVHGQVRKCPRALA